MSDREELRAAAQARLGTMIGGKFRLQRVLGIGGMAVVYAATHRNGKQVALKLLHPTLAVSERQRRRFLREAYVANTVEHPGVVQVHDDGIDADGTMYLVLELLEGQTLGALARLHGGKLDPARVLDLADQLLDVLAAAHARGVVHRDIKPDNLFVTTRGQLKVLDFGIARMFEQVPGATVETQHGSMLGTPAFMPQEQARGRWDEVDARSDLWAVGATMFTLLTGTYVHAAETANELLGKAMATPARSLGEIAPQLPTAVIDAVDKALRFEREQRWPDAKRMQHALRSAWDDAVLTARSERESASGLYAVSVSQDTLPADATESMAARSRSASDPPPPRRAVSLWLALSLAIGVAIASRLFGAFGTGDDPSPAASGAPTAPLPTASSTLAPATTTTSAPAPATAADDTAARRDPTPTTRAAAPATVATGTATTTPPASPTASATQTSPADRRPAPRTKAKRNVHAKLPDPLDIR
jgi:serine/threonine-protein kinase